MFRRAGSASVEWRRATLRCIGARRLFGDLTGCHHEGCETTRRSGRQPSSGTNDLATSHEDRHLDPLPRSSLLSLTCEKVLNLVILSAHVYGARYSPLPWTQIVSASLPFPVLTRLSMAPD